MTEMPTAQAFSDRWRDVLEEDPQAPFKRMTATAWRWVRVYWVLAAVILAAVTAFRGPVWASIASTPHPELVYAIFLVAAISAVLLGRLLHNFVTEHRWFEELKALPVPEQDRRIAERSPNSPLTSFYKVYVLTRGLPLAVRQPALEDELSSIEGQMVARQSLANLLAGSLVGLGLVGTFIGLLQTLGELSGVFAALGGSGGSGQDSAAMFSTMIVKLQGPMQGMGTAFVASLYGLLGSLVMGLTANGVKSAGERMFGDIRKFLSNDLYPSAAVSVLGLQPTPTQDDRSQTLSIDQWAQLFAVIREEHRAMRDLFVQWEQSFSKRFDQLANVASTLNHQLVETVDFVGEQAELNAKRIEEVSTMEGRLAAALDEKGTHVVEQIDSFRKDLTVAQASALPLFGRVALLLAVLGALAGLAAMAMSQQSTAQIGPQPAAQIEAGAAKASAGGQGKGLGPKSGADPISPKAGPSKGTVAMGTVIVQPGDSLARIARRHKLGINVLIAANPQVRDPRRLMPGDVLHLPKL